MNNLLTLNQVSIYDPHSEKKRVDNLSFSLKQGRTLAIVGESGSGKSLISKAIVGLLPSTLALSGEIFFDEKPLHLYSEQQRRALLGTSLGMIVQNGMSAFDPLIKIGKQVSQTLIYHFSYTKLQAFNATKQALDEVFEHQSLMIMQAFPHQLSGGQLQRVMIAMALALSPRLLIADEPTTALDAPLRREILQLLQRITISKNTTLIFISHDLGLVSQIADDILVMKEGKLIEFGDKNSVLDTPKQAYTRYLIEARAKLSQRFAQVLYAR
ncbi:ABC transporter ATP-binding protein [Proteus mirabilis]|uniref:ABC transporter ATP-binding protein n=1 Tax=Proteus mirabilis TaxID=584 RepID=UPI0006667902|nr:ABC transporter ATP-binding protein [Proteus mirabilis]KAB7729586.1 ATP-binding cassette domain-containing protein [Proteus mirabilis]MCT8213241.1 ABC transporter ATP-binding protein [Proteus mirabilis]MCT8235403.1 ABC transporter ATP-binding protein [Proteus mirabilis]MCZ4573836.1 ABC transporter ATP-binding protein [Proteus mirabilis]MCZ4574449.1 ABC transporter ATP-binding protein [Proteus mirabilis]